MKITKRQLKTLIKEELHNTLNEYYDVELFNEGAELLFDPVKKAQELCAGGDEAACKALELVKKCKQERIAGHKRDDRKIGGGHGPICQKAYRVLKTFSK